MEHPHASQHDTSHICPVHHDKADAHEDGHRHHDPHLGFPRHAFALGVAFQVVLVEPGAGEPGVKLFGAFAKAEGCPAAKTGTPEAEAARHPEHPVPRRCSPV